MRNLLALVATHWSRAGDYLRENSQSCEFAKFQKCVNPEKRKPVNLRDPVNLRASDTWPSGTRDVILATRLYIRFLPDYQSGKFTCHPRVCIHTPVCIRYLRCCVFDVFQNQLFGTSIPFAQERVCGARSAHLP